MAKRKGFNCEKNWRGRSYKKGGERIDGLAEKTELSEAEQEKLGVLRSKDSYEAGDDEWLAFESPEVREAYLNRLNDEAYEAYLASL